MATDDPVRQYHIDETTCGPLCQHPQCWASNRRTERGLPRLKDPVQTSWDVDENEGALPTLKVQNLLAESDLDMRDSFPTQRSGHHRSSSAPAVDLDNGQKHNFPYTPYTSPLGVRSTSAQSVPASLPGRRPGKAKSVEVRELFEVDELNSHWQKAFVPSQVYVWCPSKKAYERQLRRERDQTLDLREQSDVSKPVTVKDMTDIMVPKAPKDKTKRARKMKKKPSRITPTGGRPYTHPSRSTPTHRGTLPVDMDESISQLLTLPRDILLDVLMHIQTSESLDKQKVQILLARLMPHIHFDQNQPLHRSLSPTPLLASGILQNKKMNLLQGRQRQTEQDPDAVATPHHQKNPFYMDDSLISAMTTSTYTALAQQLPAEESAAADDEARESGRMARTQPLGPIHAPVSQVQHIRNKLTSVSTKSLPPIAPGSKLTKPFDYKGVRSLDLTLGPLPTPDHLSPEKPSTPRSEKASTLYVTLPSFPSPDRTEMTTPLLPYGRLSAPSYAERFASQYLHDTPSPIASEDFHPLHSVSPSLSTGVPQAPLGTPASTFHQPFQPRSASHQRPGRSPSPTKQGAAGALQRETNTASGPGADPQNADALGTIREARSEMTTSYPGISAMETGLPPSPLKHGMTPVLTPSANCTSITTGMISGQASRSPAPPVTPQPSMATPEPWPIIDERDFMISPEKPRNTAPGQSVNMATPMAPPPSPEPQELKNEFEFAINDMSKSVVTSLTPLVEEGEEEEEWEESLNEKDTFKGDGIREEDQAVENKTNESEIKTETEETKPNFGHQIHESPPGKLPEPGNEIPAGGAVSEGDIENVFHQDTAKETLDVTALDLPSTGTDWLEHVPAIDGNVECDNSDEVNPDATQDNIGETSINGITTPTTEFLQPNETGHKTHDYENSFDASANTLPKDDNKSEDQTDRNTVENQEAFEDPVIPAVSALMGAIHKSTNEVQALIAPDKDDNEVHKDHQTDSPVENKGEPARNTEIDEQETSSESRHPGEAKSGEEDSVEGINEHVADLDISN